AIATSIESEGRPVHIPAGRVSVRLCRQSGIHPRTWRRRMSVSSRIEAPSLAPPDVPTQGLARALSRSPTKGSSSPESARYSHAGHDKWLAAQKELLNEIADDGHSDTKFVRGAYGAGKSHFLSVVQDRARQHGWMTAHVECKVDGVQIDRFETLYPRIATK